MSWVKRLTSTFLRNAFPLSFHEKRGSAPRGRRVKVEALEDRRLLSVGGTFDFGDLPDNYGTTLAADGARHEAVGPMLGATRDAEVDGLPTVNANGDDYDGTDDENGVWLDAIQVGQLDATATVNVQSAPSGAKLDAWIDFDRDGAFGADEQIADTLAVAAGDNLIEFDVPSWAVSGRTNARFRLSSEGVLGATGAAADGEVEDYRVIINAEYFVTAEITTRSRLLSKRGSTAAIDGDYSIVASHNSAYVYHRTSDGWQEMQCLLPPSESTDTFGKNVDIAGDWAVVSDRDSLYVYQRHGDRWDFTQSLTASQNVDVAVDGETIAIADRDHVELWIMSDGTWEKSETFEHRLVNTIDLNGGTLGVACSWYTSSHGYVIPGYVSVYRKTESGWINGHFHGDVIEPSHLTSDFDYADGLGLDVAVDGDRAYGVADDYPLPLYWSQEENRWKQESRKGDGQYEDVSWAFDDGVLVWGEADRAVFDVNRQRIRSDGNGPSIVAIDNGTILQGLPDDGLVRWYDIDPTPHEFLVPAKREGEIRVDRALGDTPILELHDPFGELVVTDTTGHLTHFAAEEGIYTLRATPQRNIGESYYFNIQSQPPKPGQRHNLGVVDDALVDNLTVAGEPNVFVFQAARDGYPTALTHGDGSVVSGLTLMDMEGNILATGSQVSANTSGVWQPEWRLDHQVVAGQAYQLSVTGTAGQFDLRVCNLVSQTGESVKVADTDGVDAFLFSASDTFDVIANGVGYQFDDANNFFFQSGGEEDTIELVDSPGNDRLSADASQVTLSGRLPGGTDYSVVANNFTYAHGYARNGGYDTAEFVGTALSDRVKTYDELVKTMGYSYFRRAKFFETVYVDTLGGTDWATMVGSDEPDVLWAKMNEMRVDYGANVPEGAKPPFTSLVYDVTVVGCERMVARARGASDWVELHDSGGNDVLIAKPNKVEMMNGKMMDGTRVRFERGEQYRVTARGFRNVSAIADQGGDGDIAKLYDSGEEGLDLWEARHVDGETWSTMSSPSRLLYEVLAFEQIGGYGFNGGLGEDHGTNRRIQAYDVDFVFEYGYWDVEVEPAPRPPSRPSGRGEHSGR